MKKISLFKPLAKAKAAIGLDIGTSSIKAIILKVTKEEVELVNAGMVELHLDPAIENKEKRAKVIEGVKKLLTENEIKAKDAIIAVPGQSVIIRHLKLPPGARGRIDQVIKFEAQNQIPFPLDKVGMDYQALPGKEGEEIKVILAAMKKELVADHLALVEEAGLKCKAIDISSLSLHNALRFKTPPKEAEVVALIDIGATTTDIGIQRDGILEFTRSAPVAGNDLTEAIQNKLGVSLSEAEKLKREEGDALFETPQAAPPEIPPPPEKPPEKPPEIPPSPEKPPEVPPAPEKPPEVPPAPEKPPEIPPAPEKPPEVPPAPNPTSHVASAISPVLENLLAEIRRSLNYYRSQPEGAKITKVILSGGSARLKNLDKLLSQRLGIPVEIANPLVKIKYDPTAFKIGQIAPSFSVAVGLALRAIGMGEVRVSLLPRLIQAQELARAKRRNLVIAACLGVVTLVLLSLIFLQKLHRKEASLMVIKEELAQPKYVWKDPETGKEISITDRIAQLKKEKAAVEKRMRVIEGLLLEKAQWLEILLEMTNIFPSQVWLTSLSFPNKNSASISSQAKAVSAVSDLMQALENSPYFENIKTGSITTPEEGDVSFGMRWTIRNLQKVKEELAQKEKSLKEEAPSRKKVKE